MKMTDDVTQKSADYLQDKTVNAGKKLAYKATVKPINSLRESRKVKIHKNNIQIIQQGKLDMNQREAFKNGIKKNGLEYSNDKLFKKAEKLEMSVNKMAQKELKYVKKGDKLTNKRQKQEIVKKSFLDKPFTSENVGERNFAQKFVTSPLKAVSSTGAGLKESLNEEIENDDMAGIQLSNQMVSPIASKLKVESNNFVARKVGFDKKAYKLEKTDKKIVKNDKKQAKRAKAKQKKIRKEAKINGKLVAGSKLSLAGGAGAVSSNPLILAKNNIVAKALQVIKSLKSMNTLVLLGGFALIVLAVSTVIVPMLTIASSSVVFFDDSTSDNDVSFSSDLLSSDVTRWKGLVQKELKKYGLENYLDLVLVIIQLESSGNSDKTPDIMQSSESQGLAMNTINTPEDSVKQGVKYLNNLIKEQKQRKVDIKTLIHAYNYGGGFIGFIAKNGGKWTQELADSFSSSQAGKMGWSSYGDPTYVSKAMKYLSVDKENVSLATPDFDLEGGKLPYPLADYHDVSSEFSWRDHPLSGEQNFHLGVDFPAPTGTPVMAVADGTVIESSLMPSYGNVVMIQHGSNVVTVYAHNSELSVKKGDTIKAGQMIAKVGSTGDSSGPHCHFEVRKDNNYTDPMKWLK